MDRLGNQFFARPGGSFDQHRALARRDIGKNFENPTHLVVLADDILKRVAIVNFLAEQFQSRQISEGLDTTDDTAVFILHYRRADAHWQFIAPTVQDIDAPIHPATARIHGVRNAQCVWQMLA